MMLDTVALVDDLPDKGLQRGQVGTVVEQLAPGVYEVEFADNDGRAYALLALRAEQLMVLHAMRPRTRAWCADRRAAGAGLGHGALPSPSAGGFVKRVGATWRGV